VARVSLPKVGTGGSAPAELALGNTLTTANEGSPMGRTDRAGSTGSLRSGQRSRAQDGSPERWWSTWCLYSSGTRGSR